jgi:hypothetical protein
LVAIAANPFIQWCIGTVRVRSRLKRKREKKDIGVPPWITGTFERLLAYSLFYLDVKDAFTILTAWIVAKLASNWQRRSVDGLPAEKERAIRVQSLIALMAGTLSVTIGAAAGALARTNPQWWSCLVWWC